MIGLWIALINPGLIGVLYCRCRKKSLTFALAEAGKGFIFGILFFSIVCWLTVQLDIYPTRLGLVSLELLVTLSLSFYLLKSQSGTKPHYVPLFNHACNWVWQAAAVIIVVLGLLLLVTHLLTQPLYAWDAWMNWVPKAIYWHHLGTDIQFVSAQEWLGTANGERAFTLGNKSANRYPELIPSLLFGSMIAYGTNDTQLIFLPWLLLPFAMSCCLYEHLKQQKLPTVLCVAAGYMLLSLPFLRTHSVLVGYADLFLTCFFLMLVIALRNWTIHRSKIALNDLFFFGTACCLTKIPGALLVLAVMLSLLFFELSRRRRAGGALLLASILFSLYVVSCIGVSVDLPLIGDITLTSEYIVLPWFGSFEVAYHPVARSLGISLFWQDNWYFLWHIFVAVTFAQILISRSKFTIAPELYVILLVSMILCLVFFFTSHGRSAINFTTSNRAFLYLAPVVLLHIFHSINSLMERAHKRSSGIESINRRA